MTTHDDGGGGVALHAPFFEFMEDALRTPVRLDRGPAVLCVQQRFYRARQYCRARSDYRFDKLKFHVRGPTLIIKKNPVLTSSQLRHAFYVLREPSDFVAQNGIGFGGLGGEITRVANSEETTE